MKLEDITLEEIKEFIDECKIPKTITYIEDNELVLCREADYDCETEYYICTIKRDSKDNDFVVETDRETDYFNFGYGRIDCENTNIKEVVTELLISAKSGMCELIDMYKGNYEFINNFKQVGLNIMGVYTLEENKYV